MIVGTKNINYEEIIRLALKEPHNLLTYIDNLVPPIVRHIPEIVNNQRYYIAIMLRKNSNLDYYNVKRICNIILDGVEVFGYAGVFIDIKEILSKCSISYILKRLYREELNT